MGIIKKMTNWKALLALAILHLGFSVYLFPSFGAEMNEIAGKEIQILDLRSGYDLEEVRTLMRDLQEEGRAIYKEIVGVWDMIYPLIYGPLLILLLLALVRKSLGVKSNWQYLAFLPLLAIGFDYLENFSTLYLLAHFDSFSASDVAYGSMMTQLKWGAVLLSLAIFLLVGIRYLWIRFR